MSKKTAAALSRIILISLVILLNMASVSSAVNANITWDNGGGDGNWNTGTNWSTDAVPNTTSDYARINMATGPVFSGQTATAWRIYLEGAGNGTITMDGGSLTLNNYLYMANTATDRGTLTVNSGTITITGHLYCGVLGTATLNMSDGAINLSGTFYVARDANSVATVNLSGGTITCNALSVRTNSSTANGTINITGAGTLIIAGDVNATITPYINNGWIKAYNGVGTVMKDYNITTPGKTTVWATISDKAIIPSPANSAANVAVNGTNLIWRPGFGAVSHDVYLGTDFNDVNNANRLLGDLNGNGAVDKNDMLLLAEYWLDDPAGTEPYAGVNDDNNVDFFDYALLAQDWMNSAGLVFKGNQDANSFSPGTLAFGTTYYWRIDEVSGPNTAKGDVWLFTTHSGKAANILPINGDLSVMSRAVLSWTAAPNAISHDVYFGTANPPPLIGNQTATIYNPGGIANSTTYYWRIDEHYSGGAPTVTGDLWTFRTMDAAGEPDIVFVQASDPQMEWNYCNGGGIDDLKWGITIDKINQLNPDFVLVTGDLINSAGNTTQAAEYQSYKAALSSTIPCYEVPGNHDISEPPDASKYLFWKNTFAPSVDTDANNPWYSFTYGDSIFIGLDDIVLRSPFGGKDVEEMNWLTQTLIDANAAGYTHKFVFMHVALFITSAGEAYNSADNLPLLIRGQLLSLFHQYGVKVVMAGHRHTNNYAVDGDLEMFTTTSCTCGLGSPPTPPGIRIFKVYSDRVEQEQRTLDSLPVGFANIKKGPYLIYPGVNTQMTVLWQVDAGTSSCNIAWGTDTTYSLGYANTTEYGTDHQHKYTITGLTPGTKYYYRVTVSGVPYTGSFNAAPAADATDVKFFMYGDTRTNGGSHNSVAGQMVSTYTADSAYQTMVLHAGDWVSGGNETAWTNEWYNYSYTNIVNIAANMPLMGCIGNHETSGDSTAAVFKKYRPFPFQSATYFSFDYGPVHVAVVDQYTAGGYNAASTQYSWLHTDLANSTKPWKIIVLHQPGWACAGGHDNDTTVQTDIQPLCVDHGVAIVLAGHVHYYSRASVPFSSLEYPPWGDVQHVTSGGGGAPLYDPVAGQPNIVTYTKSLNYCRVAISGNTLTCTALSSTGTVLDTFTLVKP